MLTYAWRRPRRMGWANAASLAGYTGGSRLPVDVREDDEAYQITAAVPGLRAEEVEIQVLDDVVTLRLRRPAEESEESEESQEQAYLLREIGEGELERSFRLPAAVDPANAEAVGIDASRNDLYVSDDPSLPEKSLPAATHRYNQVKFGDRPKEKRFDLWIWSPEFLEESVFAEDPAPLNLCRTANAEIDRAPSHCLGSQRGNPSVHEEMEPANRVRSGSKRYPEKCEQPSRDISKYE